MKSCHFCGGNELDSPGPWIRAEFLDYEYDGVCHEAWVCSRGRDAYLPGEPDDETPDLNTCRGFLLDEWRYRKAVALDDGPRTAHPVGHARRSQAMAGHMLVRLAGSPYLRPQVAGAVRRALSLEGGGQMTAREHLRDYVAPPSRPRTATSRPPIRGRHPSRKRRFTASPATSSTRSSLTPRPTRLRCS